jgi:hypothetical protein
MFRKAGIYNSNNNDWQLWQQDSHPVELNTPEKVRQRLNYLHKNPVRAGFVTEESQWRWSSAYDYAGGKGALELIFIDG